MKNKKPALYIISILLTTVCLFSACSENGNEGGQSQVVLKTFSPNPAAIGEEIVLAGDNLDQATAVIFSGTIEITDFSINNKSEIRVKVPEGTISDRAISLKTNHGEIQSRGRLNIADPTINSCNPMNVNASEILKIKGKDLGSVKKVVFFDQVVVEAIDFNRKTNDEIRIIVPENVASGTYPVKLITASGETLTSPNLTITAVKLDPVTDKTIMIMDFEAHGGNHNGGWDNSWNGISEIKQDENKNTYWRGIGESTGQTYWLNCNHQSAGALAPYLDDASKYIMKVDIKIEKPFPNPENFQLQIVFHDDSHIVIDHFFPVVNNKCTTNDRWMTLRFDMAEMGFSGPLDGTSGINGLRHSGGNAIQMEGVCLDNWRFDPK